MKSISIRLKGKLRASGALVLVCFSTTFVLAQAPLDEIKAPSTGTITGRVVSETGQPLQNATVSLRGMQPLFQSRTVITDNDGNFQMAGLESILYSLFAIAPSYVIPPRDPDSPPEYYRIGDAVTLTLMKGGVITGTVQSATGDPVVQISVRATMVRDVNGQPPRYLAFQQQRMTDDRGIYRIYGLPPGTYVVSTGGRGMFSGGLDPYDTDASTYAPSSPRDTAAEINVRAGEETSGVDIRHRAETGRMISGTVTGLDPNANISANISLYQISHGVRTSIGFTFQLPTGRGFAFYGISDGDYDLSAQVSRGPGEIAVSEYRRVTVKGADVSNVELAVKTLGAIRGKVALEKSEAPECKNKRQPLLSETLLLARRNEKESSDQPRVNAFFSSQVLPGSDGEFQLSNLGPGQYNLSARFFAKYWYLRSISRETSLATQTAGNRSSNAKRRADLARDGLTLKFGERQSDVIVTLAEGAGSLRGVVKPNPGETLPAKLHVHLVPAEKDSADDVLRFFADEVKVDGTFTLNNLPPGRYWILARKAGTGDKQLPTTIRAPTGAELRTRLRKEAEAEKTEVEFRPCQNVIDYTLPFR